MASPKESSIVIGRTMYPATVANAATKSKWGAMLIGAKPGGYLMAEMPQAGGLYVKLEEGTNWSANFISRGSSYSFNTEVLRAVFRPAHLLTLSYPEEAEVAVLRTVKRYPVSIPVMSVVLQWPDQPWSRERWNGGVSATQVKAVAVDISKGGFMMVSPDALAPETVMENIFYLPSEAPVNGIRALVRTCRGKPGRYFIGMAYIPSKSTPEPLARLNDLITRIENMPLRL
jgi:c-di-GMP-binding flagellar brake protein YcgR